MAIELVQEIGRRTTVITQDIRETVLLFQRLSTALQRGNVVSFLNAMNTDEKPFKPLFNTLFIMFTPAVFVLVNK